MKNLSHIFWAAAAVCLLCASCSTSKKVSVNSKGFPTVEQGGKIAIVAHRGFWKSEEGGFSENSIAALKAAQDFGFWGCECDIHLTADDVIIVNHDNDIKGKRIWTHKYADFDNDLLPNGEKRPTFDKFLDQAKKSRKTILVIEFKAQLNEEREALLVDKTMQMLKDKKMFDPDRVAFISFSRFMCRKVAKEYPQFINQYLSGKVKPETMSSEGINGLDYHYSNFQLWPNFVKEAHDLGMSVNAWTVDKDDPIREMANLGVDAITTNVPLRVRELIGEKEFRK